MDYDFGSFKLTGPRKINVLLGKNGSGKSTLLKSFQSHLQEDPGNQILYITPERAGTLKYEPNIERNIERDDKWLIVDRKKNQSAQFKQQSIYRYRKLQLLFYQELESIPALRENPDYTFEKIILGKINSLLDNIYVKSTASGIETYSNSTGEKIRTENISSGESELISLVIECLCFLKEANNFKKSILLLDEPDVHLHPDLQNKFGSFLVELLTGKEIEIFIATHSTAFLSSFVEYADSTVGIISAINNSNIIFKPIDELIRKVLPVFGAHPLSNHFNEKPILLVEGDDDHRIWEQAIRTSQGSLKVQPVAISGIDNLSNYESLVVEVINSIYDEPVAYSLRDRDETTDEIEDILPLKRFKLGCRASENLLLSDEVLNSLGTDWESLKSALNNWISNNDSHPKFERMVEFQRGQFQRQYFDLKEIRNIIISEAGTSKPWEVVVGQVIGKLKKGEISVSFHDGSICNFLSEKLVQELFCKV